MVGRYIKKNTIENIQSAEIRYLGIFLLKIFLPNK
jgi:hypothetical protein